jgi:hypothetical protein
MGLARLALVLALGAGIMQPARSPNHVGYAVRYGPGVMESVARTRHAPPMPCYVAYTLAGDQDMARLWLRIQGPAGTLDCLVVDLPRPGRDKRELLRRRVWVELGYRNRWICGKGWSGRARDCEVRVWVLRRS